MANILYENYTSTSVLHGGNESQLTKWSVKYFKKYFLPHLGGNKQAAILEIGCGYGRYTRAMVDLGYVNLKGIDISEEQINYARKEMKLENVVVADGIEYLRKNRQPLDLVLLIDVMEHLDLEYSIRLEREIYQALKPGGKFIIHVPNGLSPLCATYHGDITHTRSYSAASMSQSLRMGGFSKFQHFPLPPLVTGPASLLRRVLWSLLISPLIRFYMMVANANDGGGIYTTNLLTVATK